MSEDLKPSGSGVDAVFDPVAFGTAVYQVMVKHDLSFRKAAPLAGVSSATLCRVVAGNPPDIDTYHRLRAWLRSEAASPTGGQLGPGTPPDTSWNKRASPPGGEWQGIDTAPRDGTWVDLWADDARWANMSWSLTHTTWSRYENRGKHMVTIIYTSLEPVAWMPLPAPPREAVGVGIEGASRTESTDAPRFAAAEDVQRKSEGGA